MCEPIGQGNRNSKFITFELNQATKVCARKQRANLGEPNRFSGPSFVRLIDLLGRLDWSSLLALLPLPSRLDKDAIPVINGRLARTQVTTLRLQSDAHLGLQIVGPRRASEPAEQPTGLVNDSGRWKLSLDL